MRTARVSMAFLTSLLALTLLACSSGDSGDSTDDDEDAPSTATRPASTRPASTRPAATATPTTKAGAPTFTPGDWTSGQAEARVTGGISLTVTGTLNDQASSEKGTTRLIFVDGTDTILISISTVYQPFALAVYKEPTDARASLETPCEVTYTDTSDKKVAGSFRCAHAQVYSRGDVPGDSTIEGTFSATR